MDLFDATYDEATGVWTPQIAPGVYDDQPNEDYHGSAGISKSHLDDIAPEQGHTPLHYWGKRIVPDPFAKPKEEDEWKVLGDAGHKAILQPDLMSQFAFVPEDAPPRPTDAMRNAKNPSISSQDRVSWWSDFERENEGKRILPVKMHRAIVAMRDAVHMHPVAKTLFVGGVAEQSYYAIDPETGALIKCRLDYSRLLAEGMIVDLKTTEDAAPRAFRNSIRAYRYDVQDRWYTHTVESAFPGHGPIVSKFVFVAVEKVYPYALGIYWIEREDYRNAEDMMRRDLDTILACRRSGRWPDFGCRPQALRINRRDPE